ncbi:hypothetical protein ABH965_000286 [Bacillus sp. RC97]
MNGLIFSGSPFKTKNCTCNDLASSAFNEVSIADLKESRL